MSLDFFTGLTTFSSLRVEMYQFMQNKLWGPKVLDCLQKNFISSNETVQTFSKTFKFKVDFNRPVVPNVYPTVGKIVFTEH